jgi:hypothetical protein
MLMGGRRGKTDFKTKNKVSPDDTNAFGSFNLEKNLKN